MACVSNLPVVGTHRGASAFGARRRNARVANSTKHARLVSTGSKFVCGGVGVVDRDAVTAEATAASQYVAATWAETKSPMRHCIVDTRGVHFMYQFSENKPDGFRLAAFEAAGVCVYMSRLAKKLEVAVVPEKEEAVATTDDPASTDEKNGEWGDNPTGGGRERDGTWMLSEDRARVVELADRFTLTPTAAAALAGALDEEPSADTDTGASAASALARASRCARVGIARAPRFDVSLLSLPAHEEAPRLRSTQPSGTIVVYKLLFGSLEHCSLRSDRAAGWVPRPASARRVACRLRLAVSKLTAPATRSALTAASSSW